MNIFFYYFLFFAGEDRGKPLAVNEKAIVSSINKNAGGELNNELCQFNSKKNFFARSVFL